MCGGLGQGGEERLLGLLEPTLLDERQSFAERRRLLGGLSEKTREEKDQDSSSEKTVLAIAWPLVPAAHPA